MMIFMMILINMMMVLLAMAFYTLIERKIMGYTHIRKGPNKISLMGILQPIADALKLLNKEHIIPFSVSFFFIPPILTLFLALLMWQLFSFSMNSNIFILSILIFLVISSMSTYSLLLAGWLSNSKFSLLGSMRSMAQTVSYEISMSIILLCPIIIYNSFSFLKIYSFPFSFLIFPSIILIWITTIIAELNRTPFDLSEGESELVSGFNTEYSSSSFTLIFMGEYTNIIAMSMISIMIFLPLMIFNNILSPIFIFFFSLIFILSRVSFPRMRYDFLMNMAWKSFLPFALISMILIFMIFL